MQDHAHSYLRDSVSLLMPQNLENIVRKEVSQNIKIKQFKQLFGKETMELIPRLH